MAWVGDAIMKNGGLARENGGSFWTKLTMLDEEDRKDGFLEREPNEILEFKPYPYG
jgi:hypothetical protein